MTQALTEAPLKLHFTTMTQYDKKFPVPFVLPKEHPNNILANVLAGEQWKNLRVAETEKYAHVTYFFNGGNEKPYPGEERELVASPKVATYDLKPEMSAEGITEVVVNAIDKQGFDVIVMNFANADMVGHSGKFEPTVRAVETVDACLGRIYPALPWVVVDHLVGGSHEAKTSPDFHHGLVKILPMGSAGVLDQNRLKRPVICTLDRAQHAACGVRPHDDERSNSRFP